MGLTWGRKNKEHDHDCLCQYIKEKFKQWDGCWWEHAKTYLGCREEQTCDKQVHPIYVHLKKANYNAPHGTKKN